MSTTAIPTSLSATDNMFTLHDAENKTRVTYLPHHGGPIIAGTVPGGASLDYVGPEGHHTYTDDQITTNDTSIGSLVTVTLNVVPDLRTLTFSLLIPQVTNQTAGSPQNFTTLAIKSSHHLSLTGPKPMGANPTYHEMKMHGVAKVVATAD